jgi:hypothetical protein|tara:strand:+ start:875 stop:1069 length:195 start_codon:yes stop_codon:yes gene_type:complete
MIYAVQKGDLVSNQCGVIFLVVESEDSTFQGKSFRLMIQETGEVFHVSEKGLNTNFSKIKPQRV